MSTKPNLMTFTATKGSASAAPLVAVPLVPKAANADQAPSSMPAQDAISVENSGEAGAPPVAPKRSRSRVTKAPVEAAGKASDLVPLGVRSTEEFRTELKIYAATLRLSMQDVVLEGIELHRQKYGRKKQA